MREAMRGVGLVSATLILSGCGVDTLLYQPQTTPEEWCTQRPCVEVGGVVLAEPWSSALVFALALLWIGVGIYFLASRRGQRSRQWFGISLVLGGLAAGSAGISYQAFSYELKCAGREYCALTNGYEIAYSLLQVASMSAMVVAVAFALAGERARRAIAGYAIINVAVYIVITIAGILMPSALLLSFEVLLLFAVPALILVAVLAIRNWQELLARRILWVLVLLVLVQVAYLVYFSLGITESLWASGVYFSANDVLHVGMLIWLVVTGVALGPALRDRGTT
ncbi:MAG: hypothetical protein B7C55_03930 [Actinomycetales bacterium mxb001]|nr:MAG: hypothetical protein B7C55_03930 [Actinomycetales bacterium mxb001]